VEGLARLIEPVQELLTAARRTAKIVSDIQSFSRQLPAAVTTADVARAIRSAISSTARELQQRARLVADIGELPLVEAEEARLEQIFVNLLVNAAQGIDAEMPEANEIRVTGRTDRLGRAVIEIRDSGRGIPPDILGRIFEPFFTTKPVGVGTGLGLAICRAIVDSIGGEIEAESEVGKGTTFRVVLPGAKVEQPPRRAPAPPIAPPTSPSGSRGRILAIDDEKLVLSTVARLISPEYQIECVESAREALALLERGEQFDLVLCDVMMPEMSGIELYEQLLRSHPDHARRVVFVTGGAADPVQDFLSSIPNACVEKPFTKAALLDTMRQQLAGARVGR
jgi:CheY-like chemotaxis protein/two-component sensor histidine kinase